MSYFPPVADIRFALDQVAGLPDLSRFEAFRELADDLEAAVLDEAAKFARDAIAPLNGSGDREGARREGREVVTPKGFRDAYARFVDAGWNAIAAPAAFGGQGLPHTLGVAVQEMWQGANMAFGLCPLLTQGAIEALTAHGTDEHKRLYLPKLVSGAWTGTMNLTEPQAGSDVGALKARAEPAGDGTYRIFGTKIFITWGEHDCAENIVHLVLARLPGAPAGTRGISLFLVPKFLANADGSPGARNDADCVGLEEKLGIHGSPTCVMSFGEKDGAIGTLIGAENKGMACMFTMMNAARLNVGIQGVGIAEAAFQKALGYARERRQGKAPGRQHDTVDMVAIVHHPDVRRTLLTMKALTEAARAICYATAHAIDVARHHPDERARAEAKLREELLTPVAKAWSTDAAVEVASLGVQVHGGMGYIEETGAAQYYRDARIAPIYEGTNGIQAIDLVMRKLPLDGGGAVERYIGEMEAEAASLAARDGLSGLGAALTKGVAGLRAATAFLHEELRRNRPARALAAATPYLDLFGTVAGGVYLARGAAAAAKMMAAGEGDRRLLETRVALARFYGANILPRAEARLPAILAGAETVLDDFPGAWEET